jgi:hypothetical protein
VDSGERPTGASLELLALERHRELPSRVSGENEGKLGWRGPAVVRRNMLGYVTVTDERHLLRLLGDGVASHHDDRTHCGLGKQTPRLSSSRLCPSDAVFGSPSSQSLDMPTSRQAFYRGSPTRQRWQLAPLESALII